MAGVERRPAQRGYRLLGDPARAHESQRRLDLFGHRLVLLAERTFLLKIEQPTHNVVQAGVTAAGERTQ